MTDRGQPHQKLSVVLFREDLRTQDHNALSQAAKKGAVVPLYIWDPLSYGDWPLGAASRFWLKQALTRLDSSLQKLGASLVLRSGDTKTQLHEVRQAHRFTDLYISKPMDPFGRQWAEQLRQWCESHDIVFHEHSGVTLVDPTDLRNKAGSYYKVFTPFWHQLQETVSATAGRSIKTLHTPKRTAKLSTILPQDVDDAHNHAWQKQLAGFWENQPSSAQATLRHFLATSIHNYANQRDIPKTDETSHLGAFLRFGEISPQTVWRQTTSQAGEHGLAFLRQLAWREFAYHLLWHRPETTTLPLRTEFQHYPWQKKANAAFKAWTKGETGVPLVDAGMRQLWQTGTMHNRVRMIAASFLVKHLHVSWQLGSRWFWDTLVDADLANNTMGWQWVAGCGADASPFFRIFNPLTQAKKFDPDGIYTSRWLPEKAAKKKPIIDLAEERKNALERYRTSIVERRVKAQNEL